MSCWALLGFWYFSSLVVVGEGGNVLPDISNDVCFAGQGTYTKEKCCRGDEKTLPECWDDNYSFGECCPNAECWDGEMFTAQTCCDTDKFGEQGNLGCWSGAFTFNYCCMANTTARSWVEVFVGDADTTQFYGMDEFYTDAQYGDDFGYYSTGRVLRTREQGAKGTQEFSHYTTFPMALSPHFGRVFCRLLFLKWINLGERTPFRVVEMGAGSGQLGQDINQCVKANELGIHPAVWRRWVAAFEYLILERSPALAKRQRERGLRNIIGDAQTQSTCQPVLAALADSIACKGAPDAPECQRESRGGEYTGASVVISNELLDAFAPIKLRLNIYGSPNVTDCRVWQEMRLVHAITKTDLYRFGAALQLTDEVIFNIEEQLEKYTNDVFCAIANTTIGQAARAVVPAGTSCLVVVIGLGELLDHTDLQLPAASHNMRLRLRKDRELWKRLKEIVASLDTQLRDVVVLPRYVYQQWRHQLRVMPEVEVEFLVAIKTRKVPVPMSAERCADTNWWMAAHEDRLMRLADMYGALGYPAIQLLVRPGEYNFVRLADCILSPRGGFVLSVDYGAAFETLGQSLSVDLNEDGIFIPPVPHELMQELPDCYSNWLMCAGRVDWTTFVDFTNIAAVGQRLGWRTLYYGPQSLLEHIGRLNVTVDGTDYSVPGYSVLGNSWASRHVQNWYGRETLASKNQTEGWQQRWTSFKMLLLEKPAAPDSPQSQIIVAPTWHLDSLQMDSCWEIDPTALPLGDWIRRHRGEGDEGGHRAALEKLDEDTYRNLGVQYAVAYEEAQLAVRMVDWLVSILGCDHLRKPRIEAYAAGEGLWLSLQRRIMRTWEEVWGTEALERVPWDIVQNLAGEHDPNTILDPAVCLGRRTFEILCEGEPGDRQPRNAK